MVTPQMKLDITNTLAAKVMEKHHLKVTDNKERQNIVVYKLLHNTMEYGVPYCPCQSQHTADTICPCKFIRDTGACRCGLFVKERKNG